MPRKPPGPPPHLTVVPLPGQGRPAPPKGMSAAEQEIWRAIVDASPERYLDGASQLLLRQIVAQIMLADRHVARLRKGASDYETEIALGKAHRDAMRALTAGLTALRCTPRARAVSRDVSRQFDRSAFGPRPWDTRADDIDDVAVTLVDPDKDDEGGGSGAA